MSIPESSRFDRRPPLRVRTIAVLVVALLATSTGLVVTIGSAGGSGANIASAEISPETPTAGERATIDVEISNVGSSGGPVEVTDVYVRTSGTADTHERIENVGSIGSGGDITVPVPVTFDQPGEQLLTVHAVVDDESGDRQTYQYPLSVEVDPSTVRADLSIDETNSSDTTAIELTNYGTLELSDVDITAAVDDEVVETTPAHDVEPDSSETATFDTDTVGGEEVTFTATYEAGGSDHETELTQRVDLGVGAEIQLTNVETTQAGSDVMISGEAANIGSADADSVLVGVSDDEVGSGSSSGEYFVGPVRGGEFAPFELTAATDSNVSSVPVEIQYVVDDERLTSTQTVDLDTGNEAAGGVDEQAAAQGPDMADQGEEPDTAAAQGEAPEPNSPGLISRLPLGLLVGVIAISGIAYYLWNRK